MTKTEDKLLRQFFNEHKKEIQDKGFSKGVMHRLPIRNHRLMQLWSGCYAVLSIAIFIVLGGVQAVTNTLHQVGVSMMQSGVEKLDPTSLLIAVGVLMILGVRKVCAME